MDDSEFRSMVALDDRHWWYRGRRHVVLSEIERVGPPRDALVLDAGCGSGRMLDELSRYGTPFGVDASARSVAAAQERGHADVALGRIEKLPYPEASFDLVTCLDVLEHTPDAERTLAELWRVTVPGGHLVLTVPAYQSLWSVHDEVNGHYLRYSARALKDAALGTNWAIERISYFNSFLLPPAAIVRLARKRRRLRRTRSELTYTPRWLDGVLTLPFRLEAGLLGHGWRLPAGLSLIAVLHKPEPVRRPSARAAWAGEGARALFRRAPAAPAAGLGR
jgi:SAM-dependent methyltransferase